MRLVVQRVSNAKVEVDNRTTGEIEQGFLVLLGVTHTDTKETADFLVKKLCNLRVFEDENEKMNLSIQDIKGELLVISQFTLYGDCRKGRRPSFDKAGHPTLAKQLYDKVCTYFAENGIKTETGRFGADMKVQLINDGPVTILLDSKKLF